MFTLTVVFYLVAAVTAETEETKDGEFLSERDDKQFSVFNVIRFPNTDCEGSGSLNGTCYTYTECTSLSGTASGACASSFGVCCVFNLACGATTSQNGSYAMVSSFSTSTDTDPCTYKYCKNNDDICKLRIDYESMVLTGPNTLQTLYTNCLNLGHCDSDTLTVGVPGFTPPPIICGYNTGQHMWVPASDSCVTINLDIDTASTATTRSWSIKVTQFECGNLMAPEESCLQYHTATTGAIANFNWDTSSTSNLKTELRKQFHLADQQYSICIRRTRGYCSICYSPQIIHSGTAGSTAPVTEGSSFGLSAGGGATAPVIVNAVGSFCKGLTVHHATTASGLGYGDYLTIENLQIGPTASAANNAIAANTIDKICGIVFNAAPAMDQAVQQTACSFATPFRVGVRFDSTETCAAAIANADDGDAYEAIENAYTAGTGAGTVGEGVGYNGFYLAYWQNTC